MGGWYTGLGVLWMSQNGLIQAEILGKHLELRKSLTKKCFVKYGTNMAKILISIDYTDHNLHI